MSDREVKTPAPDLLRSGGGGEGGQQNVKKKNKAEISSRCK